MKIIKSIKLSLDNIKEIIECPVVYRVSKIEIDPLINDGDSNLKKIEKPHICIFVQGFKCPCRLNDCGYLVQDTNGYWRYLGEIEFATLQTNG